MKILDDFGGIDFEIDGVAFHTKLLALHNISLIILCVEVARKLGMALPEIARGVAKINHVSHRLEPIYNTRNDVWVLDDSYNGNPDGIISGIEVLKRAKGRKIVLTPGLVENWEKRPKRSTIASAGCTPENKIDLVLLIKSKSTDYIIEGLRSLGFTDYKVYNSTQEAHASLPQIIKKGDTIIFQNDLPDNYF